MLRNRNLLALSASYIYIYILIILLYLKIRRIIKFYIDYRSIISSFDEKKKDLN